MRLLSLFVVLISVISCSPTDKGTTTIIPQVQEVEHRASYFNLNNFTLYADENAWAAAELLSLELKKLAYPSDTIVLFSNPIKANSINLVLDADIHENPAYYELNISKTFIIIKAAGKDGLLHGLYSLLQLLPRSSGINDSKLACLLIKDYPKFKWRGLLLDCSRHFMEVDFVKRYIDLLAYHKFNVLHWHLTEDQGWRIEIKKYPKLTDIGAWRTQKDGSTYGGFYTQSQIKDIIAYASQRGVRVVPEIELPGHCLAALASYPEYSCTGGPFKVSNDWGVFKDIYCAGNDSTFAFLENILDEVLDLFPSEYIHIGGDESPKFRWENCTKCQKRMAQEGLHEADELQSYFIKRIETYLNSKRRKLIGWDEILEGGLAQNATVQSWRGFEGAAQAAKKGHDAIVSPTSHAYLDYGLEAIDLEKTYQFDPIPKGLSPEEALHIIGGECAMWSERAPQNAVDSKVFPRILAMAEVLWTYSEIKDYPAFYQNIQSHYKRLEQLEVKYGLETVPVHFSATYAKKAFTVKLAPGTNDLKLQYTLNNSDTIPYDTCFALSGTQHLKAWASKNGKNYGTPVEMHIYQHKGLEARISGLNSYADSYSGKGDRTVLDGLRGSTNFRDGNWQGYSAKDFVATLSFDTVQKIDTVISSYFQYNLSWIFMPTKITVYTSTDGLNYYNRAELKPNISTKRNGEFIKTFVLSFPEVEAKYVKIKAENYGFCPSWHPAAGSPAWLFVDELRVY